MSSEIQKLRDSLRKQDKEIKELKEFLAEAEAELKEYTNSDHMVRPKGSILESQFLNKAIKGGFFVLLCAIIIMAGLYPWLFKDRIFGEDKNAALINNQNKETESSNEQADDDKSAADAGGENSEESVKPSFPEVPAEEGRDIFKPAKLLEVVSDLGWLNVRTEPDVETGKIIQKINSGEDYEWLEKTENNWYKVVIDQERHTGFVSGEYVIEK